MGQQVRDPPVRGCDQVWPYRTWLCGTAVEAYALGSEGSPLPPCHQLLGQFCGLPHVARLPQLSLLWAGGSSAVSRLWWLRRGLYQDACSRPERDHLPLPPKKEASNCFGSGPRAADMGGG